MAWRAMNSLLVLRDQVNVIAPNRSKESDGLVGDEDHQDTNSDHNPHNVPGVGSEIVTALDLTHDPTHGFDSYKFAEVLRTHRDKRIKYVISNHRIFSSYSTSSRAAWTWGPYSGSDPHTNHVHISVLDESISDTTTPWDLEGFSGMELNTVVPGTDNSKRTVGDILADLENLRNFLMGAETAPLGPGAPNSVSREGLLLTRVAGIETTVKDLMTKQQAAELITAVEELTTAVENSTGAAGNYDAVLTRRPE